MYSTLIWYLPLLLVVVLVAARLRPAPARGEMPLEPGDYQAVLAAPGANKIFVIKVIREVTGLDLVDCKRMLETPRAVIRAGISREGAEKIKQLFGAAGATVEIGELHGAQ